MSSDELGRGDSHAQCKQTAARLRDERDGLHSELEQLTKQLDDLKEKSTRQADENKMLTAELSTAQQNLRKARQATDAASQSSAKKELEALTEENAALKLELTKTKAELKDLNDPFSGATAVVHWKNNFEEVKAKLLASEKLNADLRADNDRLVRAARLPQTEETYEDAPEVPLTRGARPAGSVKDQSGYRPPSLSVKDRLPTTAFVQAMGAIKPFKGISNALGGTHVNDFYKEVTRVISAYGENIDRPRLKEFLKQKLEGDALRRVENLESTRPGVDYLSILNFLHDEFNTHRSRTYDTTVLDQMRQREDQPFSEFLGQLIKQAERCLPREDRKADGNFKQDKVNALIVRPLQHNLTRELAEEYVSMQRPDSETVDEMINHLARAEQVLMEKRNFRSKARAAAAAYDYAPADRTFVAASYNSYRVPNQKGRGREERRSNPRETRDRSPRYQETHRGSDVPRTENRARSPQRFDRSPRRFENSPRRFSRSPNFRSSRSPGNHQAGYRSSSRSPAGGERYSDQRNGSFSGCYKCGGDHFVRNCNRDERRQPDPRGDYRDYRDRKSPSRESSGGRRVTFSNVSACAHLENAFLDEGEGTSQAQTLKLSDEFEARLEEDVAENGQILNGLQFYCAVSTVKAHFSSRPDHALQSLIDCRHTDHEETAPPTTVEGQEPPPPPPDKGGDEVEPEVNEGVLLDGEEERPMFSVTSDNRELPPVAKSPATNAPATSAIEPPAANAPTTDPPAGEAMETNQEMVPPASPAWTGCGDVRCKKTLKAAKQQVEFFQQRFEEAEERAKKKQDAANKSDKRCENLRAEKATLKRQLQTNEDKVKKYDALQQELEMTRADVASLQRRLDENAKLVAEMANATDPSAPGTSGQGAEDKTLQEMQQLRLTNEKLGKEIAQLLRQKQEDPSGSHPPGPQQAAIALAPGDAAEQAELRAALDEAQQKLTATLQEVDELRRLRVAWLRQSEKMRNVTFEWRKQLSWATAYVNFIQKKMAAMTRLLQRAGISSALLPPGLDDENHSQLLMHPAVDVERFHEILDEDLAKKMRNQTSYAINEECFASEVWGRAQEDVPRPRSRFYGGLPPRQRAQEQQMEVDATGVPVTVPASGSNATGPPAAIPVPAALADIEAARAEEAAARAADATASAAPDATPATGVASAAAVTAAASVAARAAPAASVVTATAAVAPAAPAAPAARTTPAAPAARTKPAAPATRTAPAAPAARTVPAAPATRTAPAAPATRAAAAPRAAPDTSARRGAPDTTAAPAAAAQRATKSRPPRQRDNRMEDTASSTDSTRSRKGERRDGQRRERRDRDHHHARDRQNPPQFSSTRRARPRQEELEQYYGEYYQDSQSEYSDVGTEQVPMGSYSNNSQNLSNAEDYYGEYYNGEEYFQPAPHEHREYYVERRGHHSIMREPYEVQVAHSMRDHDSQDYFVAPAGYAPPTPTGQLRARAPARLMGPPAPPTHVAQRVRPSTSRLRPRLPHISVLCLLALFVPLTLAYPVPTYSRQQNQFVTNLSQLDNGTTTPRHDGLPWYTSWTPQLTKLYESGLWGYIRETDDAPDQRTVFPRTGRMARNVEVTSTEPPVTMGPSTYHYSDASVPKFKAFFERPHPITGQVVGSSGYTNAWYKTGWSNVKFDLYPNGLLDCDHRTSIGQHFEIPQPIDCEEVFDTTPTEKVSFELFSIHSEPATTLMISCTILDHYVETHLPWIGKMSILRNEFRHHPCNLTYARSALEQVQANSGKYPSTLVFTTDSSNYTAEYNVETQRWLTNVSAPLPYAVWDFAAENHVYNIEIAASLLQVHRNSPFEAYTLESSLGDVSPCTLIHNTCVSGTHRFYWDHSKVDLASKCMYKSLGKHLGDLYNDTLILPEMADAFTLDKRIKGVPCINGQVWTTVEHGYLIQFDTTRNVTVKRPGRANDATLADKDFYRHELLASELNVEFAYLAHQTDIDVHRMAVRQQKMQCHAFNARLMSIRAWLVLDCTVAARILLRRSDVVCTSAGPFTMTVANCPRTHKFTIELDGEIDGHCYDLTPVTVHLEQRNKLMFILPGTEILTPHGTEIPCAKAVLPVWKTRSTQEASAHHFATINGTVQVSTVPMDVGVETYSHPTWIFNHTQESIITSLTSSIERLRKSTLEDPQREARVDAITGYLVSNSFDPESTELHLQHSNSAMQNQEHSGFFSEDSGMFSSIKHMVSETLTGYVSVMLSIVNVVIVIALIVASCVVCVYCRCDLLCMSCCNVCMGCVTAIPAAGRNARTAWNIRRGNRSGQGQTDRQVPTDVDRIWKQWKSS